jgi:muramoyltetrapeptide carboxypeptidase
MLGHMPDLIRPPRVLPGATIGIVASSSPARDPGAVRAGIRRLERAGYRVRFLPHARAADGYLAGSASDRVADLHDAFADPDIDAVLQVRGGYGAVQLLEQLDWTLLRANPKPLIGMSDTTVLHVALLQRAGIVSLWGPGLAGLGRAQPRTWARFLATLCGRGAGEVPAGDQPSEPLRSGVATAPLVGGTTSLLASLLGTPWQLETRGRILLLEDTNEAPYRLDRLLTQLRQSGALPAAAGVVFGEHAGCGRDGGDRRQVARLLRQVARDLDVPVLAGLPLGHGRELMTVPLGVPARLDAGAGVLTVLDPGLA